MKPFSIQCDSCQAKLKVTKRSAIGQILACPKCGSLVKVTPPAGLDEELGSSSEDGLETPQAATETSPESPPPEPTAADGSVGSRDLLPSEMWTSAESRARRKLLTLGGIIGLGIVIAVVAIGYLVTQLSRPPATTAQNDTDAQPNESATDTIVTPPKDPEATPPTPAPETNDENTSEPATDSSQETQPAEPTDLPTDLPPDPPTSVGDTPSETPTNEPPVDDQPPGFETDADPSGDSVNPFDVVLADLNALGSIMEESAFDKARASAERELRVAYRVRVTPAEVFAERPKPRDYDVTAQLALVLPEVSIGATTLSQFVELVRNLTGVPIMIEPEALDATGVTMAQTLSIAGSDRSLGDLLTDHLGPLGLGWYQDGNLVVVSVAQAQTLTTEEVDLGTVADAFLADDELLPQLIMAMIDPPSWAPGNETSIERQSGKLIIRQTPLNQYRIREFLNRWQAMLADSSTEQPKIVNRRDKARELLETPVSLEHLQPVFLSQLVEELSAQIDGQIIVDWKRLGTEGWTIETELTCSLLSLPLDLALDDLLRPAGLSFRVINERLLQITTTDSALGDPDIEFYRVGGLLAKGVTAEEIARQLPQVFRAVGTQEPGKRFFFDPESGLLVAALPQPQQRALARFLSSWIQFQGRSDP